MAPNREDEIIKIKGWIEERRRKMEGNVPSDDNNAEESTTEATHPVASNIDLPKDYYNWPEDIQKRWTTEYELQKRFAKDDRQGIQIRRYLDWFERVPWGKEEVKNISIIDTKNALDEGHYGMNEVKQIILEVLAVQKLKNENTGLILLLTGPPGVGKTSLSSSIAKALEKPFKKISMGGMTDELTLKGADRAYQNSFPGAIIRALCECGTSSPVLLFDEVDKIPKESNRGDCSSILLDILDTNRTSFVDNFLQVPFDLSEVLFICAANEESEISKPLKDRMEHIEIKGYTYEEKLVIAKRYIIPKKLKETGIDKFGYFFKEEAIVKLAEGCENNQGMRDLERLVTAVCRRIALLHLQNQMDNNEITRDFILAQNISLSNNLRKEKRIGFYMEDSL
jgi:ATP-dependent Lon protease